MRECKQKGFAKLNLYLDILHKREDGYHELCTVFQSIGLYDEISVRLRPGEEISLRCSLPYLPTDGRNLAVKAANLFYSETGLSSGLHINILKTIPVGAGMAGGSTDAARVLDILNRLHGEPLSGETLEGLALRLGADVPFCLNGGTVLATGVGEKQSPLPPMPPCWLTVTKPRASVSTKDAYDLLDAMEARELASPDTLLDGLKQGDLDKVCAGMFNAMEAPVSWRYPEIGRMKRTLLENGAMTAMMTGSGSAVFGVFREETAARQAADAVGRMTDKTFVVRPIHRQNG